MFTVRIDPEKQRQLDALATKLDRSRNYLVNLAITDFLEVQAWQMEKVQEGIAAADGGDFVPEDEMKRIFDKYREAGQAAEILR